MDGESNGRILAVKNWHVLLTLAFWLVTAVLSYAKLSADTSDNTRRIQDMEQQHVRKEQFSELRDDIIHRLDRIETKVDAERTPARH